MKICGMILLVDDEGGVDMTTHRPVWVEISLDHIAHNVKQIRNRVGDDVLFMATVKGDGYGHGAYEVAKTALQNGADSLAVATLDEGIELRRKGISVPILILGLSLEEAVEEVIEYDLRQTVCDAALAKALSEAAKKAGKTAVVHLKVDTGMNRIGVQPGEVADVAKEILEISHVELEGVFTHFATAYFERDFTLEQFSRFEAALKNLEKEGIRIPIRHCANSGGVINFPETYLDQIRPGSILVMPLPAQEPENHLELLYAFVWKTKVVHVRPLKKGESVGYNRVYTADSDRMIAVLPVGWGDGLPPDLGNRGEVLIQGKRCPYLGQLCMDQSMVDVTHLKGVTPGEEVVLLGPQGKDEISHLEWANHAEGQYNHVILRCLVTKRVPRVYFVEGKQAGYRSPLRPELEKAIDGFD